MSDALPLPPRPKVEDYKKLAKDFQRAYNSGDPGAVRQWASRWVEALTSLRTQAATSELEQEIRRDTERVERQWQKILPLRDDDRPECALADAQLFVARCHGFASWPKFAEHLEAVARAASPVSQFESAADSIIGGDIGTLETLLRENPGLVRMRSTREHRSTLLHYVSANGVEDFRQKTPKNIVEITKILLDAGAEVDAESDAYGGRSTTLGLTATSYHPQAAGVQLALMELLIERGAIIDGPDGGSAVNGCLHNGRGEAAEFFAERGARLDLEGAAGVGRLDIVSSFFQDDGTLKPAATPEQMKNGFAWACEFGRTNVVDFLLRRGMDVHTRLPHDGQTGLHWAACGGHADTVKLLLERGASVSAKDQSYDGSPLEWAVYGWGNSPHRARQRYYAVVTLLVRAGAKLDSQWFDGEDEDRRCAVLKLRSDPGMLAALRGEMPE
jgi:ankyrin repeat protein